MWNKGSRRERESSVKEGDFALLSLRQFFPLRGSVICFFPELFTVFKNQKVWGGFFKLPKCGNQETPTSSRFSGLFGFVGFPLL